MFDEMGDSDPKEILKRKVQEFLSEFELSEESPDDMKALLSMWEDEILTLSIEVGGTVATKIKTLFNVCDDYASGRGMVNRVRKEAEEIRIQLDI